MNLIKILLNVSGAPRGSAELRGAPRSSTEVHRDTETLNGMIKKLKKLNFFKLDIFTKVKSPNIQNVKSVTKSLFLNEFCPKMA